MLILIYTDVGPYKMIRLFILFIYATAAVAHVQTYYINLKHRTDRRQHMEKLLSKWPRVERVNALTVADADGIIEPTLLKKVRAGVNDKPLFTTNVEDPRCVCKVEYCKCLLLGGRVTKGAAGCASSHAHVWKKIVASGEPGFILEDDIDNVPAHWVFDLALSQAPKEADLLYFGTSTRHVYDKWTRANSSIFGAFAYVLSPKGAKKLLNSLPMHQQSDSWMSSQGLNTWVFRKIITTPSSEKSSFGSDVQILTERKPFRVGITAHDLYSGTWAIIHHTLSMYESIERTKHWEPVLVLTGNNKTVTVRNYTYRSIGEKECYTLDTMIFSTSAWTSGLIKKYCPNVHTVRFTQGPSYFIMINDYITNKTSAVSENSFKTDTVWVTPQYTWSASYLKFMNNATNVYECPYVWTPKVFKSRHDGFKYIPGSANRVGVYETNRGIYKMSIIPMLITEEANKEISIDTARAEGLNKLTTSTFISDFLSRMNIVWKGGKNMAKIPQSWEEHNIGTVVSHQLLCELNYLWLEALYSGMVLVHNSEIMKDCGYYYEGFNITDGAEALKRAIRTHDTNEEQRERDQECIWRYSVENEGNIQWYERLLNNTIT